MFKRKSDMVGKIVARAWHDKQARSQARTYRRKAKAELRRVAASY